MVTYAKSLVAFAVIFFLFQPVYAQSKNSSNPWGFTAMAAGGQATFAMSHAGPSKFPALELRLGGGASYGFSNNVYVEGQMVFGVRAKREAFNKPGQPSAFGAPFASLDRVSSGRDHYFFEIPVRFVYRFPHPKIGVKAGMNYRFFMPDNDDVDFLTNRGEAGIMGGLFYRVNSKWHVGADGYYGLTEIYSAAVMINGYEADFIVRNQFLQLYIEYQF